MHITIHIYDKNILHLHTNFVPSFIGQEEENTWKE